MQQELRVLELEEVRREYETEDAIGIPMSMRERYEKALTEIRDRIRKERKGEVGKRLGEILVETGALNQAAVQQGLAEQRLRGNLELLGEVLLSMNLIKEEASLSALRLQVSTN